MMSPNTSEIGRLGERAVAAWLRRQGFDLLETNWRNGRYEIDLIACKAGELHIVEVKARRAGGLTEPEAALTLRKQQALLQAARSYVSWRRWPGEVRFDLAAVDLFPDGRSEVRWIPDAVQCHW